MLDPAKTIFSRAVSNHWYLYLMILNILTNLSKKCLSLLSDAVLKKLVLGVTFEVKRRVTQEFSASTHLTVVDGPFRGARMLDSTHGGSNQEVFGQSIGTYEAPVTRVLTSKKWLNFIDIGAESGFYVAGMLKCGWARHAYAFEDNLSSQQELIRRLDINGVSAKILGHADFESVRSLIESNQLNNSGTVVLCDIEGAEFEMFSESLVLVMNKCTVVIELHDPEGNRTKELIQSFGRTHAIEVAKRDTWFAPFLSDPSLSNLSDHQKMLLISEGRAFAQSWLIATPVLP